VYDILLKTTMQMGNRLASLTGPLGLPVKEGVNE
jgi:hypothetical protein